MTRRYDTLGHVLHEELTLHPSIPFLGEPLTRQMDYDETGDLPVTETVNYAPALQVQRKYDTEGALRSVRAGGVEIAAYRQMGPRTAFRTLPEAQVETAFAFDAKGRIEATTLQGLGGGAVLDTRAYVYDGLDNLTDLRAWDSADTTGAPSFALHLTYDALHRLDSSTRSVSGQALEARGYTYDGAGNRELAESTTLSDVDYILAPPTSTVHKYSQTVVDTTATDWAYDDSGNFTGVQGGAAYVYNAQNRMAEYVPGPGDRDAERWEYVYDGFGRRARKVHVVEGEVAAYFDFAYDGDQVIAEYASTAAAPEVPERSFVYGAYIDEPIAMDVAGERYYFVSDATRSVALLLGEAEPGVWQVAERYAYEDFGEAIILDAAGAALAASAFGNPYFFQGRRFDAELGLYYYRNRYYDPIHGRFTSRDPLGFWGDPANMGNPYTFVANNPWSYVDPWGLCGKKDTMPRLDEPIPMDAWGIVGEGALGALTLPRLLLEGVGGLAMGMLDWWHGADETFETNQAHGVQDIYAGISLGAAPPRTAGEYYNALGSEGWQRVRNSGYETARDLSVNAAAGLAAGQAMRTGRGTPPQTVTNNTRGWRVGDPLNNGTRAGNTPSWSAVRQRYWKNEALNNPGSYGAENLRRMRRGRAPQRLNPTTGRLESKHLHHDPPQSAGGLYDVYPQWPDAHYTIHNP